MKTEAVRTLSPRQLECLRLVAKLKKTEQIADALGISPSTVNTHIERAMVILGVTSRRAAASIVLAYDASLGEKFPTEFPRLVDEPTSHAEPDPSTTGPRRRRNDLTWMRRSMLAVATLAVMCIAIAGLGAAIEQLSDWRTSLGQTPHAKAATRGSGDPS